jgi:hypothetical protein
MEPPDSFSLGQRLLRSGKQMPHRQKVKGLSPAAAAGQRKRESSIFVTIFSLPLGPRQRLGSNQ